MSSEQRKVLEKFVAVDFSKLKFPLDGDSSAIYNSDKKEITIPYWMVAELLNEVKATQDMARSVLAKPVRNCDKFNDVDEAYNMFMRYVECENPLCIKPSPLHTVWDVLDWVLSNNKKKEDNNE